MTALPLSSVVPSTLSPWRTSALASGLSGVAPASFTTTVREFGAMRISSCVVGTPCTKYPGALTDSREDLGRLGKSKAPVSSVVTARLPWLSVADLMPSLVRSSTTRPRSSTVLIHPPSTVAMKNSAKGR